MLNLPTNHFCLPTCALVDPWRVKGTFPTLMIPLQEHDDFPVWGPGVLGSCNIQHWHCLPRMPSTNSRRPRRRGQSGNFPGPAGLEHLHFCSGEKWPKTNLSLCLVLLLLFRSGVKWVPQSTCTSTTKHELESLYLLFFRPNCLNLCCRKQRIISGKDTIYVETGNWASTATRLMDQ